MAKSLGRLAYEIHVLSLGVTPKWDELHERNKLAWEETAICIQYIPKILQESNLITEEVTSKMKVEGAGSG